LSDTVYNVSVVYKLTDSGAPQKVDKLADSFKSLSSLSSGIASKMDGLASSIMGVGKWALLAAGALGLRALQQGITGLNADAESATIGIAGMLQAGGAFTSFQDSMSRSQELMGQMRRDAAALPGTFDDLRLVFQGGLLPGLAAGKTSTEVEHLAARFMSVGKMLQVDSHTAGRELSMLLEGRAGAHVVMWARLAPLIGKTAQEFNKMTSAQRFEAISKAMNGFDPAIKEYEKSWDAVSSTTMDVLHNFERIATTPLFSVIKEDLFQLNTWFSNNQALVAEWAMIVGGNLVAAYEKVKDALQWIARHHSEILTTAKHAAEGGLVARAGLGLLGNAGGAGMARSGLTAIGGLVGGGVGSGALLAAAVIAPLAIAAARGKVDLQRLFGSLERAASPLVTSFVKLGESLLPTIEDLGRFSAGLIEAVADGLTPFTNALGRFISLQADSIREWSDRMGRWSEGFMNWSRDHGLINDRRANQSSDIPISDLFSLNPSEGGLALIRHLMRMGRPTLLGGAIHDISNDVARTGGAEEMDPSSHYRMNTAQMRAVQEEVRRQTHAQGHTTVNVRIESTINDASDPQRVYMDTRKAVWDAVWNRSQSPTTPVLR
jgi:hypothetical protein